MRILFCTLLALCAGGAGTLAAPPLAKDSKPVSEVLTYSINWPTGLSLGEARLTTVRSDTPEGQRIDTTFHLDASVPGFPVVEDHRSTAGPGFCSIQFDKKYTHGKRKSDETLKFDQTARKINRMTNTSDGKSEIQAAACAKDALAYIGFLRAELAAGRIPAPETVYYGAGYQIRVNFAGTQKVKVGGDSVNADRIQATIKGPKSDVSFEMFFEKNKARTPVLVRVPLALATFSLELVRP